MIILSKEDNEGGKERLEWDRIEKYKVKVKLFQDFDVL